jgi:hypothetical protein
MTFERTKAFRLGPLPPAAAASLGCALRRAAETRVAGAAVVSVTFTLSRHVFQRPAGLFEDLDTIARRFARLRVRHEGAARSEVFAVGGPQRLTGRSVADATGLEVLDPDQLLATLGPDAALEVALVVEGGCGCRVAPASVAEQGFVPLAARFTPLVAWAQHVEGEDLCLAITTDGQMTPRDVLRAAAERLPAEARPLMAAVTTHEAEAPVTAPITGAAPLTLGKPERWGEPAAVLFETFHRLTAELLPLELVRCFPLDGPSGRRRLTLADVTVVPPAVSAEAAMADGASWLGDVLVGLEVHGRPGEPVTRRRVRWAGLPWLTPRGTFIVDGIERVLHARAADGPDGAPRLQRIAGQLLDVLRRVHETGLDRLTDALDTDADVQAVVERLALTAAWCGWLREGPTAAVADTTNALSVLTDALSCRSDAARAKRLGLIELASGWWAEAASGRSLAARAGGEMLTRAMCILDPEAPLVATGLEPQAATVATRRAPHAGRIEAVGPDGVRVGDTWLSAPAFVPARGAAWPWRLCAAVGAEVEAGEPLAEGGGILHGELALGRNLLVAFHAEGGELLAAERLAVEDAFTTVHVHQVVCPLTGEFTLSRAPSADPRALDARGVVKAGFSVAEGEVLIGRLWRHNNADASLRTPAGGPWQVTEVREVTAQDRQRPGRLVVRLAARRALRSGDRLAARTRELGPVARLVATEDLPRLPDGRVVDLVIPGAPGDLRTEAMLGLISAALGRRIIVPPGTELGARDIGALWHEAGLPPLSAFGLYDGRSGQPLGEAWTLGVLYVLKVRE